MNPTEKAEELVEIAFKEVSIAYGYIGSTEVSFKHFKSIEDLSKAIAKKFVDEIIKSHIEWGTEQDECIEFLNTVKAEISFL